MRGKKALCNIISNLALQFVIIVYGFVVPKIIITNFGSNVNGLISSITQFLGYIALLESGFGPVVKATLYKPISKKNREEIALILKASEKFFRNISKIFLVYILFLAFFYPVVLNNSFSYIYTFSMVIIISISTFAEYYFGMTYRLYLQAEQKNYIISIIQVILYVFCIMCIILLSKMNVNIHLIKLITGLIFVFRPIIQNFYVKKKYCIDLKNINDSYKINNKWDGLAQHIAYVIHSNTDIVILTLFSNLLEVSVYSIYRMVTNAIKALIQSLSNGIDALFGDMIAKGEYENLNHKYNSYEIVFFTVTTIIFTCTILLIVPFIQVYTKGIQDANYIRKLFAYLIVIGEYIWAIRLPYSSITLAAGHFKETRKGAWIEALCNIIISICLVFKYGIIGVAIGTIVAMSIRTIEYIYHTNKYILKRNAWKSWGKILLVIIETLICIYISHCISYLDNNNYFNWIINAIMVTFYVSIVTITINILFFKKDFKSIIKQLKK